MVQIWSRYVIKNEETRELHRVARWFRVSGFGLAGEERGGSWFRFGAERWVAQVMHHGRRAGESLDIGNWSPFHRFWS